MCGNPILRTATPAVIPSVWCASLVVRRLYVGCTHGARALTDPCSAPNAVANAPGGMIGLTPGMRLREQGLLVYGAPRRRPSTSPPGVVFAPDLIVLLSRRHQSWRRGANMAQEGMCRAWAGSVPGS